jgi:hypothetical protein
MQEKGTGANEVVRMCAPSAVDLLDLCRSPAFVQGENLRSHSCPNNMRLSE